MIPLFDAHCDTSYVIFGEKGSLRKNGGHTDLERRRGFSPCAQVFALFEDGGGKKASCGAQLEYLKKQLEENSDIASLCRTAEEAKKAFGEGKTAAFLSVEGAELLGCSIPELERAYGEGVRFVNLTWNYENELSGSNAEGADKGLSEKGKSFVRRCRELNMLPDMSHISERAFWDVYDIGGPMFASHSNSKAVWNHRRSLTDAQFKAIAETGGCAGLNLYSDFLGDDPDLDCVVAHAERFLSLGGERAVCMGADLDGCERLPRGVRGIEDMGALYEAFLRLNYCETLVRAIFFDNLFSLIERTLKK